MNLLVVDDERFAVEGITRGIDWSDLPISQIYEAYDMDSACRIMKEQRIDIMISDIEMPGKNGLELLAWAHEHSPYTETVFLTGHANFSYAQQAIHLGSFDYVLKPVDHDHLKEVVAKAIEKARAEQEILDFNETYKTYYHLWLSQLPILTERFWQDLLARRIPPEPERLERQLRQYQMPLDRNSEIVPVLISVEQWRRELSTRDEEIMEYAVRKAAAELILREEGIVIQQDGEYNLVLLYDTAPVSGGELAARCREFIQACNRYFHCDLSCYIGERSRIGSLDDQVERLLALERNNVAATNAVVSASDKPAAGNQVFALPGYGDWTALFEFGKKNELLSRIDETLAGMQREGAHSESLEGLYYGILNMVYTAAHRKGLSVREMTGMEIGDPGVVRSVPQLKAWAFRIVQASADYICSRHKDVSAVIGKVQTYIAEHLHEDLTREDIATSVYLNSAYLSRLFKKETGMSLTDYILKMRMEKAKKMLAESNDKISNIAEAIGYFHFSHFTKMFKKITGITPQEYRKKYQDVDE